MTACPEHAAELDTPCLRCGSLACAICLQSDAEGWCSACQKRRPPIAWRSEGLPWWRRLLRFVWALTSAPQRAGSALKPGPVGRGALFAACVTVMLIAVHAAFVVIAEKRLDMTTIAGMARLMSAIVGLWCVSAIFEWPLLRALGLRVSLRVSLAAAGLSLAPVALMGWLPLFGVVLAIPWSVATRIGLIRGMTTTPPAEVSVAVLSALLLTVFAFFALRLDVLIR